MWNNVQTFNSTEVPRLSTALVDSRRSTTAMERVWVLERGALATGNFLTSTSRESSGRSLP